MEEAILNVREMTPPHAARGVEIYKLPELIFFNNPESKVIGALARKENKGAGN